jgi:hypothetical protein
MVVLVAVLGRDDAFRVDILFDGLEGEIGRRHADFDIPWATAKSIISEEAKAKALASAGVLFIFQLPKRSFCAWFLP